jgi:transcriptional regulator with XRE-family HTH domain
MARRHTPNYLSGCGLIERFFLRRTVGEVLCRGCLAARLRASLALRLRSLRLAAGPSRRQLEQAAGLTLGQVKELEEGTKPQQTTRARLARALGAPELVRFEDDMACRVDCTGKRAQLGGPPPSTRMRWIMAYRQQSGEW